MEVILKFDCNTIFFDLEKYVRQEDYKGWDPYDQLNSKIFNLSGLHKWDIARLLVIQLGKRSPVNFRRVLNVPKEYNSKGLALCLQAYCKLHKLITLGHLEESCLEGVNDTITFLSNLLLNRRVLGFSGACWGYNFPWQARRLFLFPAETPTVVATAFCSSALFSAYEITGNKEYLEAALSSSDFVLNDLKKRHDDHGFILSYSPLQGNDTVYNASLLGAKILSQSYTYTKDEALKRDASAIINYAVKRQGDDGSWEYGQLPQQSWKDSFHTGYNLESIACYSKFCCDDKYSKSLDKGMNFYINQFFTSTGIPKYFYNKTYPIDIHCPGQLWNTIQTTGDWQKYRELSQRVFEWTVTNMRNEKGFFYYQKKRFFKSKISYMRWSNAFMLNALASYMMGEYGIEEN